MRTFPVRGLGGRAAGCGSVEQGARVPGDCVCAVRGSAHGDVCRARWRAWLRGGGPDRGACRGPVSSPGSNGGAGRAAPGRAPRRGGGGPRTPREGNQPWPCTNSTTNGKRARYCGQTDHARRSLLPLRWTVSGPARVRARRRRRENRPRWSICPPRSRTHPKSRRRSRCHRARRPRPRQTCGGRPSRACPTFLAPPRARR